jgi:hypothetical protein
MSALEDRGTLAFAQAVVRLRSWLDELAAGKPSRPVRLEAAARRLVELASDAPDVLARLAVPAQGDVAARVVGASILAIAAARELTGERAVLLDVAVAGLVCGAGVARLRGEAAPAGDRAPGLEAAALLGVRSLSPAWLRRITIAYEAEWLARGDVIGPAYRGARAPTVHARLVAIARRLHGIGSTEAADDVSPELALSRLEASFADAADRTVVALLRRALRLEPPREEPEAERAAVIPPEPTGPVKAVAAAPARPEPTARGRLGETPLANILVYALDHGLGGSLELVEPDGATHVVFVVKGAPAKARLADGALRLGDELVRVGALSASDVEAAVKRAAAAGALLGEQLLGEGRVPVAVVVDALETQLRGRLALLAAKPAETTYAFYKDVDLLGRWGGDGVESDGLALAYAVVRAQPDRARIRASLAKLGDTPLALHPRSWFDAVNVGEGRAVVAALQSGTLRAAELLAVPSVDPETAASVLYTLAVTRHLALPGQAREPMGSSRAATRSSAPGAPAAPKAEPARRSPPAMPPAAPAVAAPKPPAVPAVVAPKAPAVPAVAAPRPPAVPAVAAPKPPAVPAVVAPKAPAVPAVAAPVAPAAPKIPAVPAVVAPIVSTAPAVAVSVAPSPSRAPAVTAPPAAPAVSARPPGASSASLPEAPASTRALPQASPPAPAARPRAELTERQKQALEDLKAAEVALARKDLVNAEKGARKALQLDPDSVEINALLLWIHVMGGKVKAVDAVLQTSHLLERDPASLRARLYRAKLYKREGKVREAMADFEQVLRADPEHREAKGELQLLQMTSRFR